MPFDPDACIICSTSFLALRGWAVDQGTIRMGIAPSDSTLVETFYGVRFAQDSAAHTSRRFEKRRSNTPQGFGNSPIFLSQSKGPGFNCGVAGIRQLGSSYSPALPLQPSGSRAVLRGLYLTTHRRDARTSPGSHAIGTGGGFHFSRRPAPADFRRRATIQIGAAAHFRGTTAGTTVSDRGP